MQRRAIAVVAVLAGGLASDGHADDRPVLHEDFRAPERAASGLGVVGEVAAGKNPVAIEAGSKLLPEPAFAAPDAREPVFGKGGVGTDRGTEHRPNDTTTMDGTLTYVEVFNPATVPFKRMT